MRIESENFKNNQKIPAQFTCDGQNISPSLVFKEVPPGTASLALILDDPDAPLGAWVHWAVWNIDPKTDRLEEGQLPTTAVQGKNSFGETGYSGPCPPSGSHRYFFKLYALDRWLTLEANADIKELQNSIKDHLTAQAQLIGLYR